MDFDIKEILGNLDTAVIDEFRSVFSEASSRQLELVERRIDNANGLVKDLAYDDGVMLCYVKSMGEQLSLISLYHSFEIGIKKIVQFQNNGSQVSLGRWDEIKRHIPSLIKDTVEFQNINKLRVLVNCFKHSGVVSDDLYNIDQSFGGVGSEIEHVSDSLYRPFKDSASKILIAMANSLQT